MNKEVNKAILCVEIQSFIDDLLIPNIKKYGSKKVLEDYLKAYKPEWHCEEGKELLIKRIKELGKN